MPNEEPSNAAGQVKPTHAAVEGPEETLEPARVQSHEEPGAPDRLAAAEALAAELREKLALAHAREREVLDRLARLQADFDNFRRRARDEAAQATARGKLDFVKTIIPVIDNLERALAHANDEGLKLLARQLQSVLAAQGLLVLDPTGEAFDAKVHEAIASEAKQGVKAGTVLTTVEKGYALDGKVVRPARVVVAA